LCRTMLPKIFFERSCVGHGRMAAAAWVTRVPSYDVAVEVSHMHPLRLVSDMRNVECAVSFHT
jgi:hypothetical protein